MAGILGGHGFAFLFRQDRGTIDRATWWRGTLLLALPLAVMTAIWLRIADGAHRAVGNLQILDARIGFTYLYLLVYGLTILLIAVCHYNLGAKRFAARNRAPGLAGLLPLGALLTGATHWLAPRMGDAMPVWSGFAADGLMLAILVWTVIDLGVIKDAAP